MLSSICLRSIKSWAIPMSPVTRPSKSNSGLWRFQTAEIAFAINDFMYAAPKPLCRHRHHRRTNRPLGVKQTLCRLSPACLYVRDLSRWTTYRAANRFLKWLISDQRMVAGQPKLDGPQPVAVLLVFVRLAGASSDNAEGAQFVPQAAPRDAQEFSRAQLVPAGLLKDSA